MTFTDPSSPNPTTAEIKSLRLAISILQRHVPQGQYRDETIEYLSQIREELVLKRIGK